MTPSDPGSVTEKRAAAIREMRSRGLTLRQICEELGVAKSMVNRVLYPKVQAYEKAYSRERYYTNTCIECGARCTFNKHAQPRTRGKLCRDCYQKQPFVAIERRGHS